MKFAIRAFCAFLSIVTATQAFAVSIPNLLFPETWIDDYSCFLKNIPNAPVADDSTSTEALAHRSFLAGIAYFPNLIAVHMAKKAGYTAKFISIKLPPGRSITSTQALWLEKDGQNYLVMRGTNVSEGLVDLITDALIFKMPVRGGGKAHAGFIVASETLWPFVKKKLEQSPAIHFIGHSLGAGIATLLANRAVSEGFAVKSLTLFGAPRVGDDEFVSQFSTTMQAIPYSRIMFRNDGVARLPEKGYKHTGGFVYLDKNGLQFDEGLEASLPQTLKELPEGAHPLYDHMPYVYTEALYRLALNQPTVCLKEIKE